MTIRWQPGKEPTVAEIKSVLSNALLNLNFNLDDIERMARAVVSFYKDRASGRQ